MKSPDDIGTLLKRHTAPAPDPEMIRRMKGDLRQEIANLAEQEAADRRSLTRRLSFAGIVSLPPILGINYLLWLAVHAVFGWVLPEAVVTFLAVDLLAFTSLLVSIAYGSLPFMGFWAMRMKGDLQDAA